MNYYLIVGERSGDLHAANLISELKLQDPNSSFRGMGGDYMAKQGCQLVTHYKEMSMMGFWEVLMGFRKVLFHLDKIKKDVLRNSPDVLILIDFGGFNMKMASFAKKHGIPVHYYIPPKVWAWNRDRAKKLKRWVDACYTILPFEPDFFAKYSWEVPYVGNPIKDQISKFQPDPEFKERHGLGGKPIIALLPGSRDQEVRKMLGLMIEVSRNFPDFEFVVAAVENLDEIIYQEAQAKGIKIILGNTYDLLACAHAAVVTSGTATLETALFNVPQIVVYKTSPLTYGIGKMLVKVPFISLVNLVAGKKVVEELIQSAYNSESLIHHLQLIVEGGEKRQLILEGYRQVDKKLGQKKASQETARLIINYFQATGI